MRAPRDILKHVCVEIAKAKRKCYRDQKHRIAKGERCLVIKEEGLGGSKNYCVTCAGHILNACEAKHSSLRQQLLT